MFLIICKNFQSLNFRKNKLGDIMARLSGDSSTLGRIGFMLFDMLKEFITVVA